MENASKALIIAGAILISILLISIGILVMNSAGQMTDRMDSSMDETAIQSFNRKFENYVGTKRGSVIKSLISEVETSNTVNVNDQITLTGVTNLQDVISTARYTVTIQKNNRGLVHQINIEMEGGSTTT
ncbi:MAG: hypothetical protein HFJ54_02465 [Clostridia bacterium]|nr:hypothetical protein [Clostridia bacterium]